MNNGVKVIVEVEIDFDEIPSDEQVKNHVLMMEDVSIDFQKRVARDGIKYNLEYK